MDLEKIGVLELCCQYFCYWKLGTMFRVLVNENLSRYVDFFSSKISRQPYTENLVQNLSFSFALWIWVSSLLLHLPLTMPAFVSLSFFLPLTFFAIFFFRVLCALFAKAFVALRFISSSILYRISRHTLLSLLLSNFIPVKISLCCVLCVLIYH